MIKPIANKWQFWLSIGREVIRMDPPGWRVFSLWVIKLRELPPEGAMIRRGHYDGFILRFKFWLPFDSA